MWLTYLKAYSFHFPGLGSAWYIITVTCRLFELHGQEQDIKIFPKELLPLEGVGPQKCLAFSVDGSRFAAGGVVSILNHQFVLYILHNCFNIRIFVHWTYLLMKGWASQNFRVAKYACHFRWTKGSQIISGYGFQVGIKFIHQMNSKNDSNFLSLLLFRCSIKMFGLRFEFDRLHIFLIFSVNLFKPLLVTKPLASLSFSFLPFSVATDRLASAFSSFYYILLEFYHILTFLVM